MAEHIDIFSRQHRFSEQPQIRTSGNKQKQQQNICELSAIFKI